MTCNPKQMHHQITNNEISFGILICTQFWMHAWNKSFSMHTAIDCIASEGETGIGIGGM